MVYTSKMIVSYSDVHQALADLAVDVKEPATSKDVLVEAISAVYHLCDQYGLSYEEVLAEAAGLYHHQRERDLKNLESGE